MDALIAGLAVAGLTALTWAAYAHPGSPFSVVAAVSRFVLGCVGTGILSYQAGAMNAENAGLGAMTSADVATYSAVRHATAATHLPWWSLGVVGLGFLYLAILESLPGIGIVKRGP